MINSALDELWASVWKLWYILSKELRKAKFPHITRHSTLKFLVLSNSLQFKMEVYILRLTFLNNRIVIYIQNLVTMGSNERKIWYYAKERERERENIFLVCQSVVYMDDDDGVWIFVCKYWYVNMLNVKGVTNISSMLHLKGPFHYLMEVFPGDTNLFEL